MSVYRYGNEVQIKIEIISENNVNLIGNFNCGNSELDSYIKFKAIHDDTITTYVVIDKVLNKVISYCSMSCSGLTHKYQNNIHTIPSIEIKYFAVDKSVQDLLYDDSGEYYFFSDYVFNNFMTICENISKTIIYARCIILYAVEDAVNFYKRLGFDNFDTYYEPDSYRYIDDCVPMYIEMML